MKSKKSHPSIELIVRNEATHSKDVDLVIVQCLGIYIAISRIHNISTRECQQDIRLFLIDLKNKLTKIAATSFIITLHLPSCHDKFNIHYPANVYNLDQAKASIIEAKIWDNLSTIT